MTTTRLRGERIAIYALVDPRTDRVRYVGQTRYLRRRWNQHRYFRSRTGGTGEALQEWLIKLNSSGHAPSLRVLDRVWGREADAAENYWIAKLRAANLPLLNWVTTSVSFTEYALRKHGKLVAAHRRKREEKQ